MDDVIELLATQHGVLSRRQASEIYESSTINRRLGREWQSPHRGVVVTHNGPLTQQQLDWAAVLAAPAGSALWGGSAARWDGFRDRYADELVHVVQPVGTRRLLMPGVVTHWSSHLEATEVHPVATPRRTRLPRSLLDLASAARTERGARAVLFTAVQQRLVTPDALTAGLRGRGPCRHRALIAETLGDIAGGIHSVPEKDFDAIVRRWRLPQPTRQAIRQRPDGRYYLDALWGPYCLCAEVDGAHHQDSAQWEADLDRMADIVADGLRQIRFSAFAVRRRSDSVGERLDRALRTGGWDGSPDGSPVAGPQSPARS